MDMQEAQFKPSGCVDRGQENLSRAVSDMQMSEPSSLKFRCGGKAQTDQLQSLDMTDPFSGLSTTFDSNLSRQLKSPGDSNPRLNKLGAIEVNSQNPNQENPTERGLKNIVRRENGDFQAEYDPSQRDDRMSSQRRDTVRPGDVRTTTQYSGRDDHMTLVLTQERDGKFERVIRYDSGARTDKLMSRTEWSNGSVTQSYDNGKGGVRIEQIRPSAEAGGHERNFDRTRTRREDVRDLPHTQKRGERTRPEFPGSLDRAERQKAPREMRGERQDQVDVRNGDSLWKIAERLLRNGNQKHSDQDTKRFVDDLIRMNKGRYPGLKTNPNLIQPGMRLDIPAHRRR